MLTALKAWLWLTDRLDATAAWQALQQFGTSEQCYFADAAEYQLNGKQADAQRKRLADKSLDAAEQILADCDASGISILTWQDAEYPERLRNIEVPPLVLYYKGTLPRFDEEIVVAMAGTRRATPYGVKVAGELAFQMTRLGALVVTGVVGGCDRHAVDGALKAGGTVVCVMAGGVDVPYYESEANRHMLEDVAACGALMSEYPPGTPHLPEHFRMRNRILTALALGTLCVEAPAQSGTLQVARLALEQGRDVFAVPANIDAIGSAGTNTLLANGEAICVCSGENVLSHYWALYPNRHRHATPLSEDETAQRLTSAPEEVHKTRAARKQEQAAPKETTSPVQDSRRMICLAEHVREFTDDEIAVLRALGTQECVSDEVVSATGLPARRVSATLTVLTIRDMVQQLPGGRFVALVALI